MRLLVLKRMETMCHTMVLDSIIPAKTLPQISIWPPAAILDFQKYLFLAMYFLFGLGYIYGKFKHNSTSIILGCRASTDNITNNRQLIG